MIASKHLFIAKPLIFVASAAASVGCGAAGARGRPTEFAWPGVASLRVAETRVVNERVNPNAPVSVSAEGCGITVDPEVTRCKL